MPSIAASEGPAESAMMSDTDALCPPVFQVCNGRSASLWYARSHHMNQEPSAAAILKSELPSPLRSSSRLHFADASPSRRSSQCANEATFALPDQWGQSGILFRLVLEVKTIAKPRTKTSATSRDGIPRRSDRRRAGGFGEHLHR